MLAVAAVLMTISVWRMRKAALGEAFSGSGKLLSGRIFKRRARSNLDNAGSILPVTGPPIVWKEMRKGFVGHSRTDRIMTILLIVLFCLTAILLLLSPRNNIFPRYLIRLYSY